MWKDVRYGIRALSRRPGFTIMAVVVLSLGIGANAAIFSIVNAFLLKPLRMERPGELAGCYSRDTKKPDSYRAFSYPNYVDLREKNPVFVSLMAHNMAMVGLGNGDTTRRVFADIVSSNYFGTFGVSLFKGRPFTQAEERPGANVNSVIVNYSYWRKTGSDPGLVGKTLRINGRIFTIVGIAPEGFTGTTAMVTSELYLPLGVYTEVMNDFDGAVRTLAERSNNALVLVGRLRPGLTLREADSRLAVVASQFEKAYPGENKDQTFVVRPLSRMSVSDAPMSDSQSWTPAILLLSMSGIVLLIASLNVANMMLARGASRRKEIAIRLAIGGGRSQIVRQLFTEGVLLAVLGGAAGLLVAWWSTSLLIGSLARMAPIEIVYSAGPDTRVFAATMAFCLVSTILFSLGPAWKLSRPDVVSDLKKGAGEDASGMRRLFSRRNLLVMGQLSLSLTMLAAAGLFVRSAIQAANVTPGFTLDNEIVAEVDASLAGYDEAHGRKIYTALLTRLRSLPGVDSATLAATAPFGITSLGQDLLPAEKAHAGPKETTNRVSASFNIVGDDYFKTLGIPLLRGRAFQPAEAAFGAGTHSAMIDKLAAERLWPGQNAVGKHVLLEDNPSKPEEVEVVGVVGTVQDHILGGPTRPELYVPFGQQYQSDMQIHVRVAGSAGAGAEGRMLEAVRKEIRAVDPHLPVLALRTFREQLNGSIDLWLVRMGAQILAIFGSVALLLAVAGLYGVKAYSVAQRTREIGIRMALGADPSDTLVMILREGFVVTMVGAGVGIVLALGVGRILAAMLYDVHAADPAVFIGAPLVLTAVSLFASYVPARRAARVDPMVALRYE